jgi:tRNA modification GTPase
VRTLFRSLGQSQTQLPTEPEPGRFWLGRLGHEYADEVVIAVKAIQPVPWLEVHCHGGREVIRLLLEALQTQGVRACSWQEFMDWSSGDELRRLAAEAMTRAITVRTAAILLDQYQGAFARAVQDILSAWDRNEPTLARQLLEDLVRYAGVGRHLTAPWKVVIAGAPNVGKSSLVNALAGYPRCVVAPTPGTTRDLVTTLLAIDGWPVEVTDTAGLRRQAGQLEEQGIDKAREAITRADLCLWLLDASAPPVWPDFHKDALCFVINKTDLRPAWDVTRVPDVVQVSALNGTGLEELCRTLSRRLVPTAPPPGTAVPFTPALCEQVEDAWRLSATGPSGNLALA